MSYEYAGKFYLVRSGNYANTLCQALNHPETDEGVYCASEKWGQRIKMGNLMETPPPSPLPVWAYAEWQTLAGGSGRNPNEVLYEFGDLEFWDDGRLLVWGDYAASPQCLTGEAALALSEVLRKWAEA